MTLPNGIPVNAEHPSGIAADAIVPIVVGTTTQGSRCVPLIANWHRAHEADDALMRLFVFPHAGGRPREYKPFAEAFGAHRVEVCTLDFMTTDMVDMEHFVNAILDITLYPANNESLVDKPFAFFGHSAGGIMAFAVALELENRGLPRPTRIFVSAHAAPHIMKRLPTDWSRDDDIMRGLLEQWGGTDEVILNDKEALSAFLPLIKSQLGIVDSYYIRSNDHLEDGAGSRRHAKFADGAWTGKGGGLSVAGRRSSRRSVHSTGSTGLGPSTCQKIGIPLHILIGDADGTMTAEDAEAWVALTIGEFVQESFPGDHFYHLKAGFDSLTRHMSEALQNDMEKHEEESRHWLSVWNSAVMEWPEEDLLHEWFRRQAKIYSNQVAVVCQTTNRTYTYQEIDDLSERLAFFLRNECGVGVGDITGILMEHCAEFVIAYIAALKAGGAYMPLEIVYPADLLQRVLETAKPKCLLTKKMFSSRFPSWQKSYNVEEVATLPVCAGPVVCDPKPTPDSLAYVVMSSGTTGMPKGIMCPHRGAVHSYYWRLQEYPFEEGERTACHVFFVWELLRPLLAGARLYVIPDDIIFDPDGLTRYVEDNAITRILVTPSLLQLILDSIPAELLVKRLFTLKIMWLCGEVVTVELRNRFLALKLQTKLLNLYSVSECHDVSVSDLGHLTDPWENPKYASCGQLIPNVRAYILDAELKMVSIGAPGELYVSGPVLALGYLNMEEKTNAAFVPNPFLPGRKMYKTGDRGRFLPSGAVELMGRCDFMVKIRGYSVVLGAIEAALAELPNISAAVVNAEGTEGSDKKLIAYIVPENWENTPNEQQVRAQLKGKLPHYAIPSVFVLLDALPLHSVSGKTDRKMLPPLESAQRLESGPASASEGQWTETEIAIRAIWVKMLDLEPSTIGRDDSFFEIGGHSLLATKLVAQINALEMCNGNTISLAMLLKNATLEGLAALVDSGDSSPRDLLNLPEEAKLDESIYPAPTRKAGYSRFRVSASVMRPQRVFLTGATGFLGAHILYQLLQDKSLVSVLCLVRTTCNVDGLTHAEAEQELFESGMKRLMKQLKDQNLDIPEDDFRERVFPVSGDLSKPLLGLSAEDFRDLATEIDAVIHSGAEVNLVKPYEALKQSNILGTQEVLRLCVTNSRYCTRVKPLHYVSTNGVFPSDIKIQNEDHDIAGVWEDIATKGDGYAQTKWVAEQMVLHARSRGLPCCVYRPGNMSPSARGTATWNSQDFYYLALKGCEKLGSAPQAGWRFDLTPVDFAAAALAHLCVKAPHRALGQIFHLQSPHAPLVDDKVFAASPWEIIEESKWKSILASDTDLTALNVALEPFEQYLKSPANFQCEQLMRALEGSGIECHECDASYISRILQALGR
eukprot:GEMP01001905.1.p1 GENE.GEMP01001905.1~~GEMP01001905.1.p1  ORF type:complete len:1374 (+),score=347.63 GEMP01001905.1:312-4433(+)